MTLRLKQNCLAICGCEVKVIATHTVNGQTNPKWNLRTYQGMGIGTPNAYWRIWERSGNLEYKRGKIDDNGKLIGLPDEFESGYDYDGYMELQQGCSYGCGWQLYDEGIVWPD